MHLCRSVCGEEHALHHARQKEQLERRSFKGKRKRGRGGGGERKRGGGEKSQHYRHHHTTSTTTTTTTSYDGGTTHTHTHPVDPSNASVNNLLHPKTIAENERPMNRSTNRMVRYGCSIIHLHRLFTLLYIIPPPYSCVIFPSSGRSLSFDRMHICMILGHFLRYSSYVVKESLPTAGSSVCRSPCELSLSFSLCVCFSRPPLKSLHVAPQVAVRADHLSHQVAHRAEGGAVEVTAQNHDRCQTFGDDICSDLRYSESGGEGKRRGGGGGIYGGNDGRVRNKYVWGVVMW